MKTSIVLSLKPDNIIEIGYGKGLLHSRLTGVPYSAIEPNENLAQLGKSRGAVVHDEYASSDLVADLDVVIASCIFAGRYEIFTSITCSAEMRF
ncbi:MAG: hypothetical protein GXY77_12485 [Fibrobacter sp.]|nr:hypothetical protein [Fibrobacter sp.]